MADKNNRSTADNNYYISADNRVHSTPQSAVDASLAFEQASKTGAGCSQASENIPSSGKK